ncbi:HAD family hydrolase [Roseateles sp. BYS180W]|uniref:HAD family hydrolase n=1 Tax=Roseateles rivi TaxID=3299028 RepID=A0ABW7FSH1_9BURK
MRSRPQRFDLIVFDWDGTLYDSTALIVRAIQAAALDLGLTPPPRERAAHVIGLGLVDAMQHAMPGLPEARYLEMGQRFRHHYAHGQGELTLFEGVPELLRELQARHHWLAVATGKTRRGLDEALQQSGLHALFDGSRTADETASKPHPQMLFELMREFGAEPERTLMVGDTSHDLSLARNAGCASLAVAWGAHELPALQACEPLAIAHDMAQLQAWLLQHA